MSTTHDVKARIRQTLAEAGWDIARLRWFIALLCEVEEDWKVDDMTRAERMAASFWGGC